GNHRGCIPVSVWYFFFQAEDGIRDFHVTGVQTCALPIWRRAPRSSSSPPRTTSSTSRRNCCARGASTRSSLSISPPERNAPRSRSEERRVGKECRPRWWPHEQYM